MNAATFEMIREKYLGEEINGRLVFPKSTSRIAYPYLPVHGTPTSRMMSLVYDYDQVEDQAEWNVWVQDHPAYRALFDEFVEAHVNGQFDRLLDVLEGRGFLVLYDSATLTLTIGASVSSVTPGFREWVPVKDLVNKSSVEKINDMARYSSHTSKADRIEEKFFYTVFNL